MTRPGVLSPRTARTTALSTLGALLLAGPLLTACDDGATGPSGAVDVALELVNVRPLDPETEGSYEGWVVDGEDQVHSAGRFTLGAGLTATVSSPIAAPAYLFVTIEPPGDDDDAPSQQKLLGGPFSGGEAELGIVRYLTSGLELEEAPGTHALFTPSDNLELGYPSNEDAGIWLFNLFGDTADASFYLDFTPLSRGWTYEGWVVRDHGSGSEVWLSYGKFQPDHRRQARFRDDTGLGPFSGQIDYEHAMPREIVMPGDDWVANPHGYPVPGGLELPLDLNGSEAEGVPSRYTHVITIEPMPDTAEAPWLARPFLVHPYRNAIGQGPPDERRVIELFPAELPRGTARITGDGTSR